MIAMTAASFIVALWRYGPASRVLEDDRLQDVRYLLAAVDGILDLVVDLFDLEDLEGVVGAAEEVGDRSTIQLVALVLDLVHVDPVLLEVLERLQMVDAGADRFCSTH